MTIFEPSTLALAGAIGSIALSSVMGFITANFQLRRSRLQDATAYEDIRERRIAEQTRLDELRAEIRILEQQIKDKDRLSAEVASLQERLDALRLEHANLDAARADIEEVKRQAADAASHLASLKQDGKAVEDAMREKQRQLEEIERLLDPQRVAALEEAVAALKSERAALELELPKLRGERETALQRIEEARSYEARKAALEVALDELDREIDDLSQQCEALRKERSDLEAARAVLDDLREEASRLEGRRNRLTSEIADLEKREADLAGRRAEEAQLRASLTALHQRKDDLDSAVTRLEARRERLGGDGAVGENQFLLLQDIQQFPACLGIPAISAKAPVPESDAIATVEKYLKGCGLDYDHRTIKAFHTCLKINDHAQITVLAGVSGTGKSMLPRRYAEAMGIHFQQIAVEPRWDSPQDLLGFYNYIEQIYRATDLARLLVHMDPYRSIPLENSAPNRRSHMALVLLDEMNLARVEYYFSEFLSRLEVRPRLAEADDENRRKNAMIPIDIRGYDKPLALYPAHNVLFAGTMNDDESTQALSDKVLDRGNIIQFAAPKKFNAPAANRIPALPADAMPFTTWKGWIRPAEALRDNLEQVDQYVSKLASIMEKCGRPFGHRLREGILAYAANYPRPLSGGLDVRYAVADQVEMRILPKLRGLEIDRHLSEIADLETLLRNDLSDPLLADRLNEVVERQTRGTGLFVWGGLTRASS